MKGRNSLLVLSSIALILCLIAYSKHFDNTFQFDDTHTVVKNPWIKDISNWPEYFVNAATFSSLPQNQMYRPLFTLSIAIDYWLAGGLNPVYFHVPMFICFLVLCALLFYFYKHIMYQTDPHRLNSYFAWFSAALFMLLTSNAETINYISARSDSYSTLWVITALLTYIYSSKALKPFLYFIPLLIALFMKQSAIMFAPLLFLYILFFEYDLGVFDLFKKDKTKQWLSAVMKSIPAFVVVIAFYFLQDRLSGEGLDMSSTPAYNYLITQPYCILKYVGLFFWPAGLTADTDLLPFASIADSRFWMGMVFLLALMAIGLITTQSKKWRPVGFGILWYLIALFPTSSVIPLAEVMNDHRMFFPNIGLIISVVWTIALLTRDLIEKNKALAYGLLGIGLIVLIANSYGVYLRSEVWHSEESLWRDVTIKSPKNARGHMNYGLMMLRKGDYKRSSLYLERAVEIRPLYAYTQTNLGVLRAAQGLNDEADKYLRKGLELNPTDPELISCYAIFLTDQKRYVEAEKYLNQLIQISPGHPSKSYLMRVYHEQSKWAELKRLCRNSLALNANDKDAALYQEIANTKSTYADVLEKRILKGPTEDLYLELFAAYYNDKEYQKGLETCDRLLKINPQSVAAYNNICVAYREMHLWDKAIEAANIGLKIDPNHTLLKNNLKTIPYRKDLINQLNNREFDYGGYLNLSVSFYNSGMWEESILSARKALSLNPNSPEAHNNICVSYIKLKEWNKAVEAAQKSLEIDPNYQLAKQNLAYLKSLLNLNK